MKQDNLLWTSKCECGANTLPLVLSISVLSSTYGKEEEKEKEGIWEWARGMGLTRGWEI